jgi:hypothetical protein
MVFYLILLQQSQPEIPINVAALAAELFLFAQFHSFLPKKDNQFGSQKQSFYKIYFIFSSKSGNSKSKFYTFNKTKQKSIQKSLQFWLLELFLFVQFCFVWFKTPFRTVLSSPLNQILSNFACHLMNNL